MIKVAKTAGFCSGVKLAMDKAVEAAKTYGKVYTLGHLIHNEIAVEYLKSKGVFPISENAVFDLDKGSVIIIRAHGITCEFENKLKDHGFILIDATCPHVKKTHEIISSEVAKNNHVIYVGDNGHEEAIGAMSYGGKNIELVGDVDEGFLDNLPYKNAAFVFQTTYSLDKYNKITNIIKNYSKKSAKSFGIFDTICYTTLARQKETLELSRNSDKVLVVGSRTSANTKRLFELAKTVNNSVYFVENIEDAKKIKCNQKECISIVAGASTPPWLVQEVNELMSETLEKVTEVEVKEEATLQEEANTQEMNFMDKVISDMDKGSSKGGFKKYVPGRTYTCEVIDANDEGIKVVIGGKKDGFIDKNEANIDGNYNKDDYKSGDKFDAIIKEVGKDFVVLSKKEVDIKKKEDEEVEKALSAGEFSLTMTEVVKGGLKGKLGRHIIFVPASQIRSGYVKDLEQYKGKTLRLQLLPPKEKEGQEVEANADQPQKLQKYLFASQRVILEREKKEADDLFWNSIHVNDIVTGKVKRFTEFGAFVNVRGYDCLAHISELSWNKITDPETVLKKGESYDFVVLKLDRESGKISLGYKQLQKKPYEKAAEEFPIGTEITGKVERIFPYGAFISIAEGVDGLVHVSQISHKWIKDANEALKVGEEVKAKIIGFEDNRITLSIKDLIEPPVEEEAAADEAQDGEEKPKRASRVKKFEQKVAESDNVKRERRSSKKAQATDEPKEWVSGSSTASLGDLFKNLNLDLGDDDKE